jgi:hypothetical protein
MRSDLSAFCGAAQMGVGDLIKASHTPDGPRPGYHTFSGPPQVVFRTRRYWQRRGQCCANHMVDQLDEGGANAAWGVWT